MKVYIDQTLCIACGLCREACPEGAVHPMISNIHLRFEVVESECTGCGECLEYCPEPGALVEFEVAK